MKRDANEEKQKKQPGTEIHKNPGAAVFLHFWNRDQL